MKQTILVAAFALCASLAATAATNTIASPDGRLTVTIADEAGRISYSVAYDGKPMIVRSALGLKANIGDFSAGLTQLKADTGNIEKAYTMANAKASRIDYRARRLDVTYTNAKKQLMTVTFCVANNDVAFRYSFPQQGETACMVVEGEATAFRLPAQATAFISPQADPMIGWKRTKPSYEEVYSADAPITAPSL